MMLQKSDLIAIANTPMPFGKYKGRVLIDLPDEYLLWFNGKGGGFPQGALGRLMAITLSLKIDGLEALVKPLTRPVISEY